MFTCVQIALSGNKLRSDFIAWFIIGDLGIVWGVVLCCVVQPFHRELLREGQVGVAGVAQPFPPNQLPGHFLPENVGSNSFHSNRMTPQQSAHYGGQYGFDPDSTKNAVRQVDPAAQPVTIWTKHYSLHLQTQEYKKWLPFKLAELFQGFWPNCRYVRRTTLT